MFLGLRTVIYPAPDLSAAKRWYTALLGVAPYFDEPFYVGYQVGGYELALDPNGHPGTGPLTYWGVRDAAAALDQLLAAGAVDHSGGVDDVGDGIRVATVRDVSGNVLGIIENPHFAAAAAPDDGRTGAGR